jgi:hypothetical protein|nr:hypothetical protein [Prevotella sp.]
MKKILFFLLSVMSLFSCKEKTPDPGYYAGIAAKGYYDMLLEGRYDEFVEGQNMPHRIPEGYRQQLVLNAKMFVEQQKNEHRGMKAFQILDAKADTAHHIADVYLSVTYGDSTKEQIVVPMVEVEKKWKMR